MFARVCEVHFKPEKRAEIFKILKEEIVPMLEQCDGFFDEIALELDTHPRKFYAISLWYDERDAAKYHKECFPKIYDMLEPFLVAPISVKHGTIDETISKKLAPLSPPDGNDRSDAIGPKYHNLEMRRCVCSPVSSK